MISITKRTVPPAAFRPTSVASMITKLLSKALVAQRIDGSIQSHERQRDASSYQVADDQRRHSESGDESNRNISAWSPSRSRWTNFYELCPKDVLPLSTTGRSTTLIGKNNANSHTVALSGHRGKTDIDTSATFNIKGKLMRTLSRGNSWTYLGTEFSAEGQRHQPLASLLGSCIERLTKAPLKRQ